MGVIMQSFFWDCPGVSGRQFGWWDWVRQQVPHLQQAGITALWLPPACKAKDVISVGYDPLDFYDLGEYKQKFHDRKETWYGSKEDLLALINAAHDSGLKVLADLVVNQCSGGDLEKNPYTGEDWYTKFEPASNKFKRNYDCFHPSKYESYDGGVFEGFSKTDLCHRNPYVYSEILELCRWLIEDIGFDGFRYDCAKGYGGWITKSIQEYKYKYNTATHEFYKPFGVGELWEERDQPIENWLDEVNYFSDNPASPGYPCVFWRDYYDFDLAQPGTRSGIDSLISAHEKFAGGDADILYVDYDLYILQRRGHDNLKGLIYVLNKSEAGWNGRSVQTIWPNTRFTPQSWRGTNTLSTPGECYTDSGCTGSFWAPPRGYAVYVPGE